MSFHLQAELEKLKKKVLALSAVAEESVQQAVLSLKEMNVERARKVLDGDCGIDEKEVELEEECLKVLALHQPVAVDLRYVVAILKMNNDLERIADLASNIAERTLSLSVMERVCPPFDYATMATKVQAMLKKSLDALVHLDSRMASEVNTMDDEINEMHSRTFGLVRECIIKSPDNIDCFLNYLTVSRNLERIADLATNIAEDVYYMIEGKIVRHTSWGK